MKFDALFPVSIFAALIAVSTIAACERVDSEGRAMPEGDAQSDFTSVKHSTDLVNIYLVHDRMTGCDYLYVGADTIIKRADPMGVVTPDCPDNTGTINPKTKSAMSKP